MFVCAEKSGIDSWHDGEEGYWLGVVLRCGWGGCLVRIEKGSGEAAPDGVGIEGELELNCGTRE